MYLQAGVTQLVECNLAKVDVAGSNPVSRSSLLSLPPTAYNRPYMRAPARKVETKHNGINDSTLREKTGKGWEDWFALLDGEGAGTLDHAVDCPNAQ